jgi:hypothetical protein
VFYRCGRGPLGELEQAHETQHDELASYVSTIATPNWAARMVWEAEVKREGVQKKSCPRHRTEDGLRIDTVEKVNSLFMKNVIHRPFLNTKLIKE